MEGTLRLCMEGMMSFCESMHVFVCEKPCPLYVGEIMSVCVQICVLCVYVGTMFPVCGRNFAPYESCLLVCTCGETWLTVW